MEIFLASFVVMGIAVAAMAIGAMVQGKTIKGSCGGVNTIAGLEGSCSCDNPCEKKKQRMREAGVAFVEGPGKG